ncbi:beta-1,3-galactosyltransferase 5-like [Physella acuta]|uniref:beta-1,3-galactosyltransferase 5-like n=1 Tax=Physella acuta TaxID=109671 RepID=UPI0027DCF248|nr:beta-1,3-galactosyltransferase 5-like [Physella acuta]
MLGLVDDSLLNNLTKSTHALYSVIPDEVYLKNNHTVFTPRADVNNSLDYLFLISGEAICRNHNPFLLVVIPSVVTRAETRDLIRKTWLRASETNSWPHVVLGENIKHIFLFGFQNNSKDKDLKSLQTESVLNNDVVMADFVDSYRNLSVKMLVGLQWTLKYCSRTRFVLKVDEDTFINMPLMVQLLKHVTRDFNGDVFTIGRRHPSPRPLVVRHPHRWGVGYDEYPLEYYPQYTIGAAYALTMPSIAPLLSTAAHVRLISPEDAFINGILAKTAGVARLAADSFASDNNVNEIRDCDVVWNRKVAVIGVSSRERLQELWTSLVTRQCNTTKH